MGPLDILDLNNPYQSASEYQFGTPATPSAPTNYGQGFMYASMGLSAISSIAGAFSQAASLRAQGDYQASVARTNSAIARIQARQTLDAGNLQASRLNAKTSQIAGSVMAQQGASGVDVASGSSAIVRNAIRASGAEDELTIRANAARRAWGYETQAIEDTYTGKFAKLASSAAAEQTLLTGGLRAVTTPLAIESNYLRWARIQKGVGDIPFPDAGAN